MVGAAHPDEDQTALVERLIWDACKRSAAVGAVTSGTVILPGIGTAASLTVGVAADIGATFKLQAELVSQIAAARASVLEERCANLSPTTPSRPRVQTSSLRCHFFDYFLQRIDI